MWPAPIKCSPRQAMDELAKTMTLEDALVVQEMLNGPRPFGEPISFTILREASSRILENKVTELIKKVDEMTGIKTYEQ